MTAALKEVQHLPAVEQKDTYVLPRDTQPNIIQRYIKYLDKITLHYLEVVGVEKMLLDTFSEGANLIYLTGNFSTNAFTKRKVPESFVYMSGCAVVESYFTPREYPQPTEGGLFVGFVGEVETDLFTQTPYGIPQSFGVIPLVHIAEAPYAFHTRVIGKTPITATAKNLHLLPELNPRATGKYALEELQHYLLDNTTVEDAKNVVRRGIQKDITPTRRDAYLV